MSWLQVWTASRSLATWPDQMHTGVEKRTRDQERAPVASHFKRVMREKAKHEERTFAPSGDVAEAMAKSLSIPGMGIC